MGNIKLLTPQIYNKIAAGEVIEKPYGAVKELVENSIDAGANRIVIEVTNGGFDLISVSDNGYGIHEDDVDLAFVKHATSKLGSEQQLNAIDTLGFRGEALSSIAAVSHVTLTTRTHNSDAGLRVTVEDGQITSRQYVSANIGTKIEVRDLFYNMPARRKFFKTPKHESVEITKFVSKLILTNPTLEITYIMDGKTVYANKGNGLEEAIFNIYGDECLSNCIKVDFVRDGLRIQGYISNPQYTKANRNYQTLSVNNRYVTDSGVSAAIMQAYSEYLMTRSFPVYVLDLYIDCDCVDVNVHPKKSEVRFLEPRLVCGAFYSCVKDALRNFTHQRVEQTFESKADEERPKIQYSRENFLEVFNKLSAEGKLDVMNRDQAETVRAIEKSTEDADDEKSLKELGAYLEREVTVQKARINLGLDDPSTVKQTSVVLEPSADFVPRVPTEDEILYERIRILGAAFNTYLILELDDKLIFVDQHAAHERILFDKFTAENKHDMQPVMFPYVFNVSDEEALFIEANLDNILSAGIEVRNFGPNTYRITAVSTLLSDLKMEEFVRYLLSSVDEFKLDDRKLFVENLAKKACKAAIKAGDTLNQYEITYIIKQVLENHILQCPHGRPITVVFSKTQLEKMFKRIV